jgi:heptosyltransferase-2/heptosyltransferase-3
MKRRLRLFLLYLLAIAARPLIRRPPAMISSVLYIKPDHLGDLLLATPVLATLRQRIPAARLTALVGPWSRMVLQRNPDVDVLLTCPFPGFERRPADQRPKTNDRRALVRTYWTLVARVLSLVRPYLLLLRYALLLRASRYDLAIVGRDDHWWGAALAQLAGVPWRVGYAVPECRPFLSSALPWNPHDHVTRQGLALVEAAAIQSAVGSRQPSSPIPHPSARFDPSVDDITWAEAWIQAQGLGPHERLVVIHPGTGGPAKLWFPERWAAVADALQAAGARPVLTGGPGEEMLVAQVVAQMSAPALALAGRTTVGQLAALLRRAVLVLGVDSGPLHLAAAQGVATLHLYGPGDDARFGPWGDPRRHAVLRAELWCSPCGVFEACPRALARPECMERIAAAPVIAQALRMLAEL